MKRKSRQAIFYADRAVVPPKRPINTDMEMAADVVVEHGGAMRVTAEQGQPATFELRYSGHDDFTVIGTEGKDNY